MRIIGDISDYYDSCDSRNPVTYDRRPLKDCGRGFMEVTFQSKFQLEYNQSRFQFPLLDFTPKSSPNFIAYHWLFVGGRIYAISSRKNFYKFEPSSFRVLDESPNFELPEDLLVQIGQEVKRPVFVFSEYAKTATTPQSLTVYSNYPILKTLGLQAFLSPQECYNLIEKYICDYIVPSDEPPDDYEYLKDVKRSMLYKPKKVKML